MTAPIGTVTSKHGLVRAVREDRAFYGYYTICKRLYVKSVLDTPGNIITCVWCIVDKDWPVDLSSMNPCGEIELET